MTLPLNITAKLTLVLGLFAALLLAGVGALASYNGRVALETATIAALLSTAIEKEAALNAWVDDRQIDIAALASSPRLNEDVAELIAAAPASAEAQVAHDRLVRNLQPWVGPEEQYLTLLVIETATGQVIAATDPTEEGKFKEDRPFFVKGKDGPYVQNLHYALTLQELAMTAAAPLRSTEGQVLAVLAGQLNLAEMNAIINRRTGLHQTDEAFLVNTSNLFVTQPRFLTDPVVLQRGVHSEAVNRCLAGKSGTLLAEDYRTVPVATVYRWLPERQLCLIVKIDQAEALAPARAFGETMLLIWILTLAGAVALAFILARTITGPVRQLMTGAEAIGAGHLDTRLALKTGDELEQLAEAFTRMATDLQTTLVSRAELLNEVAERQQAEATLRESEAKYRLLAENMADVIWILNTNSLQFTYISPSVERLRGFTVAEVMAQPLEQVMTPHSLAMIKASLPERLQAFLAGDPAAVTQTHDVEQTRQDGTTVWTEVVTTLLWNDAGEVEALGVSRDISERKRVEQKIERQNQRLKILREIDTGILAANSVENIVGVALRYLSELIGCQRAAVKLFDWATGEILIFDARTVNETSAPKGMRVSLAPFQARIQTFLKNQPVLIDDLSEEPDLPALDQIMLQEGLRSQCALPLFSQNSLIGSLNLSSEEPGYFDQEKIDLGREVANQIAIAITQSRLVETLRESEEKYYAFFQASLDAILLTSPDGSIQAANPAACTMLGRPEAEICALNRSDLVDTTDPKLELLLAERTQTGKTYGELTMLKKDGSPFPVEMSSALFQDRQGHTRTSMIIRDITERKQAEAALLASKAKLEAALASMTDAVFISDVEGHFIEFNEAFATFHKFKSKEECAKTFAEYPNILDVFMANGDLAPVEMWAVPRALRGEIGTNVEYSLRRKDTGESWVGSYSFAPIRDEAGTIVGSVVVGRDITERKKMEDDLRQSEDKFSKAFKSSPAALLITRLADGRFLELNDAYSAIVGYERAELIGRLTTDFKIYLNSADRQAIIERLLATGSIRDFETAIRHRSGATRHVIAAQELLTFNGEACILSHLLDITERKQAEAEIRQLNAELEQRVVERTAELTDLYNNAPCGYHSLDAEGVFVRINDTELRWLGYSREEILGKMKATDLFTPASVETFRQVFPVFKTRGWMENVELDMIRKDGSILSVLLSATVITDQTGDYLMSRSTMIDYTDRKRAEAALRKTQTELQAANKELEAFSYSVSHDLRAPLRAIDGFSQALLEDYTAQLDAEGQRYLQRVRAASQRMAELIDDLLTLSRIARSEMHREAVNLSELAQAVIETLGQAEPERAVEVVIAPGLVVWADARLLRAALENLLGNAWKFTARQPQARIELGRMTQTDQTVYFVRDNGAGFDMAYADKLFGAFQRLHSPADFAGSGIGLATVQRIIHRHGGRIWAEGEVDHGATFYFTLSESRNDRRDHHE